MSGPSNGAEETKRKLLSRLLDGVKNCQSRFGSRSELATEDDPSVQKLCFAFEDVFLHGIKKPRIPQGSETSSKTSSNVLWQMTENFIPSNLKPFEILSYWPLVKSQLSKHEAERFLLLHKVRSDLGRARAWLRASLNEHSLERFILIFISFQDLHSYYEPWAFMLDHELNSLLPQTAAGLGSILFALIVDNPILDIVERPVDKLNSEPEAESLPEEAQVADQVLGEVPIAIMEEVGKPNKKKKKKVPTTFVSFDDGDSNDPPMNLPSSSKCKKENAPQHVAKPDKVPELKQDGIVKNPEILTTPKSATPGIQIQSVGSASANNDIYSSSLKSDCLSLYSDCSDRLDNISLSDVSPDQRLKPVSGYPSGLAINDFTQDLIPVPIPNASDDQHPDLDEDSEEVTVYEPESYRTPTKINEGNASFTSDSTTDDRLQKLKSVLDHEVEIVTSLKAQLADAKRHHKDKAKILDAKIESLSKENEILKHQLKKYIGAVQLLKSESRKSSSLELETSTEHVQSNEDESNEAAEYERKLIQVAEMHGELMEFNAHLQVLLQRKDQALKRMREELIDLRGPFAAPLIHGIDEMDQFENDIDALSFGSNSSGRTRINSNNDRVLINIWIPSAFLTGATNDLHHVYQVFIRIKDTEWNVYRRYSQFYCLHRDLKKRDGVVGGFYFPPKKHIGNKDTKFVDDRRRKLQDYLRKVINHNLQTNTILASHPEKNMLISILPFFGETNWPESHKKTRERSRSRSLFFRQSSPNQSPTVPQYTGL